MDTNFLDADFAGYAAKLTTNEHELARIVFRHRDEEEIRESGYQVAGHQENRASGKGRLRGKFCR
jgi:hypothetical protein